jgi:ribosome biogenesis protein UTP30
MDSVLQMADVEKAVVALKECVKKATEQQERRMLIEEEKVDLQFSFKKYATEKTRTIKMVLPHPPEREALLFVKDVNKRSRNFENTTVAYQDLIKDLGIQKLAIMPLKELKIEYTDYEAKRRLSNLYEIFLADARIIRLLPSFLGSTFIKRKRYLVQVRMTAKDLKDELNKALGTTMCILSGKGSTSQVVVGHLDQESESLAKNIVACFEKIQKEVPGGLQNLRNAQIKCGNSLAVPLFVSFDSKNDVELPKPNQDEESEEEEDVATVLEGKVLIRKGRIEIIKPGETKKGIKRKAGKIKKLTSKKLKKRENS